MEYEQIKNLMSDMSKLNLSEVNIELSNGTKVNMKKEGVSQNVVVPEVVTTVTQNVETVIEEKKGYVVTSPMVGIFYAKPSPTSEPFVEVGKSVKVGDTLCIIEAMKLMNEIEAEYSGKVVEILVENESTVEYGTPLFRIGE